MKVLFFFFVFLPNFLVQPVSLDLMFDINAFILLGKECILLWDLVKEISCSHSNLFMLIELFVGN